MNEKIIYLNLRISDVENEKIEKIMHELRTDNRSKAIRTIINRFNPETIKGLF
jgi:hypothetical protein